MRPKLHNEPDIAIKSASAQIVGLHIELADDAAKVIGFPHDYLSPTLLAWLVKVALGTREIPEVMLYGSGAFNSSTYLFEVQDGKAAAMEVMGLLSDMKRAFDVDTEFVLLNVCEIAWWDNGAFKHVHPTAPEGRFERWLSVEKINAQQGKAKAYQKRLERVLAPPERRAPERSVKTPHAKRVAELFRQAEEMRQ
jgi:hypothetical protein